MSPEETTLAAQVVVLPGFALAEGMGVVEAGQSGMTGARGVVVQSARGPHLNVRWTGPPLEAGAWMETSPTHGTVPDLTHLATAGILLGMLQRTRRIIALTPHVAYDAWYVELDIDPSGEPSIAEEHLGVAAARALVAIGRCA